MKITRILFFGVRLAIARCRIISLFDVIGVFFSVFNFGRGTNERRTPNESYSRDIFLLCRISSRLSASYLFSSFASLLAVPFDDKVNHFAENDHLARCLYLVGFGCVCPRATALSFPTFYICAPMCTAQKKRESNKPAKQGKKRRECNCI